MTVSQVVVSLNMGVLDGPTAFILGASAGIAQASARLLAIDGATLYLLGDP